MKFLEVTKQNGIATITLSRGKVNAFNEAFIEEIGDCLNGLEADSSVRAIILTGKGKFFSFGFDIPEFLNYSREEFFKYLTKFSRLYTRVYLYPKPVVAALNGHTVAGGCMLALACDFRIMVSGKARIALNEITFGASVFAGSVEMLKMLVGGRNAERILFGGNMYSAEEAYRIGLVDEVADELLLRQKAEQVAGDFSAKQPSAFRSIKKLLRKPIADGWASGEEASIREFVEIWYSDETWEKVRKIEIHS